MNKYTKILHSIIPLLLISISFILSACSDESVNTCQHQWIEADCLYPKTCRICNETEGTALGHYFVDATCTESKTCRFCYKTEGVALGHKGKELSKWDNDYYNAIKVQEYRCTICKEMIITQTVPIKTFINGKKFTIHSDAFAYRFIESLKILNKIDFEYYARSAYELAVELDYEGTLSEWLSSFETTNYTNAYDINESIRENNVLDYLINDENNKMICRVFFGYAGQLNSHITVMDKYTENCFSDIIMNNEDIDIFSLVFSACLAVDPSLDYSNAILLGQIFAFNLANRDDNEGFSFSYNGIEYYSVFGRLYIWVS